MATIGILGAGRMGTRLAKQFVNSGHQVILGSRSREKAERICKSFENIKIRAGNYQDAVQADWILPAIFLRDGLLKILNTYRKFLKGKLYIDISNPFNDEYDDFILPWDNSSAEEVQRNFQETRVVGAFKNVWWEVFDTPEFEMGDYKNIWWEVFDGPIYENKIKSDVFVISDDVDAKNEFLRIVVDFPFRFLDAGELKNARTIERMTLLSGELGKRYGFFPRMNYVLLGDKKHLSRSNETQNKIHMEDQLNEVSEAN